jgi:hypothetical protein
MADDPKKPPAPRGASAVDRFLDAARSVPAPHERANRGRLVFALDATMSRQPTWDLALSLQSKMFEAAAASGGLDVQLVYFRGFGECRASRFVADGAGLAKLMSGISVRGGQTQIGKALRHIRDEAQRQKIGAFVYVGDAMEEDVDALAALAGELGLRGIRGFAFQEGHEPAASAAFATIARLTGGAHARFDVSAPASLLELLRGAAAYAAGGREAMLRLAGASPAVKGLLAAMEGGRR